MPEKPRDSDEDQKEEGSSAEEDFDEKEPTEEDRSYSSFSDVGKLGRSKKIFERLENPNGFGWRRNWKE